MRACISRRRVLLGSWHWQQNPAPSPEPRSSGEWFWRAWRCASADRSSWHVMQPISPSTSGRLAGTDIDGATPTGWEKRPSVSWQPLHRLVQPGTQAAGPSTAAGAATRSSPRGRAPASPMPVIRQTASSGTPGQPTRGHRRDARYEATSLPLWADCVAIHPSSGPGLSAIGSERAELGGLGGFGPGDDRPVRPSGKGGVSNSYCWD
jgi:hypothetical protein